MPHPRDILQTLRQWLTNPAEEATRWQRALQFAIALTRHCWYQLWEDRAPQMAAALTYRTIFGLVPVLVLGLVVFNAFGGFEDVGREIQSRLYDYMGLSSLAIRQAEAEEAVERRTVFETEESEALEEAVREQVAATQAAEAERDAAAGAAPAEVTTTAEQKRQLRAQLDEILDQLNERVADVSFRSIGAVGLVLLIWAAIGLVASVEDAFNQIYHTAVGRSWHMRIAIYWAVITLGPVLLALSMWLTGQVMEWIGAISPVEVTGELIKDPSTTEAYARNAVRWTVGLLGQVAGFMATWLLMFLLYVLMPNASVKLRPAVIGSLVASLLWEIAKWGFALYVERAVGYSALYGTLGLIPLSLFWLYLTWLIVLFGLQLTYTLQTMRGRRLRLEPRQEERDLVLDPRWAIPLVTMIADAFQRGQTVSADSLSSRLNLPMRAVTRLTQQLEREGLVRRVFAGQDGDVAYSLALPPDQVTVDRLLEVVQSLSMSQQTLRNVPGADLIRQLQQAQQEAARQVTLASLVRGK